MNHARIRNIPSTNDATIDCRVWRHRSRTMGLVKSFVIALLQITKIFIQSHVYPRSVLALLSRACPWTHVGLLLTFHTDSRQQTPLVPGVWRTYEVPQHEYSISGTQRFSSNVTGFFLFGGSSNYLVSISGRAFQLYGPKRAQAGLSYRRPLNESRAIRFYGKADNLFNQTYFENGFRTPKFTIAGGMQFEF